MISLQFGGRRARRLAAAVACSGILALSLIGGLNVQILEAALAPPEGREAPAAKKESRPAVPRLGSLERTAPRLSDQDGDGDPDKITFLEFLPEHGWGRVEVVEDDDDLRWSDKTGDRDSDIWIVDYGPDGVRDRMVDYVDNDGDGDGDEMAVYYYRGGLLVWSWLVEDLDDDNRLWELSAYEYQGARDQWRSDFSGNNSFSLHKYDQSTESWLPFSENPFLFYSLDDDGYSEEAIRFVTLPNDGLDANDPDTLWSPLYRRDLTPEDFSVVSIRYSWDLDNDSGRGNPYDYDFGFTRVGKLTYPGYLHRNPGHRFGGVWPRIPWEIGDALARTYRAASSGFVWDESDQSNRWEGAIWHNGRRSLNNAGGPAYPFNARYEYDRDRSDGMGVYWHPADRRIHALGADEGWMAVDWDADGKADYRLTLSDSNRNGFFDGWSVDLGGNGTIELLAGGGEAGVETLPLEYESLGRRYREELPRAIQADLGFINYVASRGVKSPAIATLTRKAGSAKSDEQRRFYLDLLRDLYYLYLKADLSPAISATVDGSARDWRRKQLQEAEEAYGRGDFAGAADRLRGLGEIAITSRPRLDELKVTPNPFSPNGDGVDDVLTFSYKLTRDATITILVAGHRGTEAVVLSRQWRPGGLNREVWKGRGPRDRALAPGNYRYLVRARNMYGTSTYRGTVRLAATSAVER